MAWQDEKEAAYEERMSLRTLYVFPATPVTPAAAATARTFTPPGAKIVKDPEVSLLVKVKVS